MKKKQRGFGVVQAVLALLAVVGLSVYAVPVYEDYLARSKMSEAFGVVADTKAKLTEFYTIKRRFPKSDRELEGIETEMFSPPEFVDRVVLNSKSEIHDFEIQIYFKPGVIPGEWFEDQYLYVAGNSSPQKGVSVEWSCGLEGIEDKYLPARCIED